MTEGSEAAAICGRMSHKWEIRRKEPSDGVSDAMNCVKLLLSAGRVGSKRFAYWWREKDTLSRT